MANKETELAFYARISDPESLNESDLIEDHIQLESTLVSGARIRVRKITPIKGGPSGGTVRYIETIKVQTDSVGGVRSYEETETEVSSEFFEAFAKIANRAIIKRRYVFVGGAPVIKGVENLVLPAIKYEVDQFYNTKENKRSDVIKIDIELDDIFNALEEAGVPLAGVKQKFDLSSLPFTSSDMFTAATATEEQKAMLDNLWENDFTVKLAPDIFVPMNKMKEGSSRR